MTDLSLADTQAHIVLVRKHIAAIRANLLIRAEIHDASKLIEPEVSGFAAMKNLSSLVYASPEYYAVLEASKATVQHHYEYNPHHPEHYPIPQNAAITQLKQDIETLKTMADIADDISTFQRTIVRLERQLKEMESRVNNMSLLDVVEMVADHSAACRRTSNGSFNDSLTKNTERFGYSDQLVSLLRNMAIEMGW